MTYLGLVRNSVSQPVCGSGQAYSISSESGYSYVCGVSSVSDGNLRVTLHSHRLVSAKDIDFQPSSNQISPSASDLFLLANVTVSNVGSGNTSLGGGFAVQVTNGTISVQNQEFIENASFPDTYPNQALPDVNGGLYLPPRSHIDLWLMFYIPSSSQVMPNAFLLQYLSYREVFYGGDYVGHGAFNCHVASCEYPLVMFIITPT